MSNLIKTFGHAYSEGVRDAAKNIARNEDRRFKVPYEKRIFVDGYISGYRDFIDGKVKLLKNGEWELIND
jgi:hypothetical protein